MVNQATKRRTVKCTVYIYRPIIGARVERTPLVNQATTSRPVQCIVYIYRPIIGA